MEPIHGRRSESKSPSESEVDDAVGETRKRRYTGQSRTTRWRQRRRRQAASNDEESTSDSDTVLQQEVQHHKQSDSKGTERRSDSGSSSLSTAKESSTKTDEILEPCQLMKNSSTDVCQDSTSDSDAREQQDQHQKQLANEATETESKNEPSSVPIVREPSAETGEWESCHLKGNSMTDVNQDSAPDSDTGQQQVQHQKQAANEGTVQTSEIERSSLSIVKEPSAASEEIWVSCHQKEVPDDSSNLNHDGNSSESNSHLTLTEECSNAKVTPEAGSSHHSDDSYHSVSSSQVTTSEESYTDESSSSDWQSIASEDFPSDLDCFQAHYLEEEPEEPVPAAQPRGEVQDDSDPDDPEDPEHDPDDPGYEDEPSSNSSEDSEDDATHEVANVLNNRLNMNVELIQNLTKGEIMIIELACAVRHRKTFESIIDQFKNLNLFFGPNCFPESKSKLWNMILLNKAGIRFHVYCGRKECGRYIGQRHRIERIARCRCGFRIAVDKAKFFITLDLKTQLKYFLSVPGIWEKLQYPQTRQKISPTAIEDILDGSLYQRMKQEGQPLSNPNNFSFIFNMDACNPTKRGSVKLVPLFIRINELPPELRQKFHFPAAIFVDTREPNYQAFLKPFVKQARRLATRGLDWKPDGVNEINSKFIGLGFNVDSPVRYSILNMSKWDCIAYGCTYCTHHGVHVAGSQRYPEVNLEGVAPFQDRSHQGMIDAMLHVQMNDNIAAFQGHKGPTLLMLMEHLDLRDGQAHDDLHQDHEGSAADLTELLLTTEQARVNPRMTLIGLVGAIDARLLSIKTPSRISRKPRSISKRKSYNGTEWRNWLFFYAVPCLLGLIKPEYLDILATLSYACYTLSQDSIEPEEINIAEALLLRVATRFEQTFGVGRMKYNLHLTTKHKVRSVRYLGNPWAYSTYNFESLNRKMIGRVTSPKCAILQIVTRVLLHMLVYSSQYDQRLPEEVRLRIEEILNPYQLKRTRMVGPHMYLVGRGVQRPTTHEEGLVLAREGIHAPNIVEYKSFAISDSRYWSSIRQNRNIKSDDSFIYSTQDTFCTIRTICSFINDNGEESSGLFVTEHNVLRIAPVARHLSILGNANEDLDHFINLRQVRCPAVKMNVENIVYATCVPNCFEID